MSGFTRWCGVSLLLVVMATGCDKDSPTSSTPQAQSPAIEAEDIAAELVEIAGWPTDGAVPVSDEVFTDDRLARGWVQNFAREVVTGDIVHYSATIRVGDGPHDFVGLHRIVRERRPYRPIRARESILAVHGLSGGFAPNFLSASEVVSEAPAVVFASNDVDFWGIDLGWALVPEGQADLSFFEDWGMQKDIDHLYVAMGVARFTRAMTGSSFQKIDLLGHSYGAALCYSYGSMETQLPPGLRHAQGLVPMDLYYKTDNEEYRAGRCEQAAEHADELAAGIYAGERGTFPLLATLARTDPDGPSPVLDWATNLQAAWIIGSSTFLFTPSTPWYHLTAGVFEEGAFPLFPSGLAYTSTETWLRKLEGFSHYLPVRVEYDLRRTQCDVEDVPFDDHLAEIDVPVFYIGAAGGQGDAGVYTTTLLGSDDVTTLVVRLEAPEDITVDFGHNDLVAASNAPELVYQPILEWMATR